MSSVELSSRICLSLTLILSLALRVCVVRLYCFCFVFRRFVALLFLSRLFFVLDRKTICHSIYVHFYCSRSTLFCAGALIILYNILFSFCCCFFFSCYIFFLLRLFLFCFVLCMSFRLAQYLTLIYCHLSFDAGVAVLYFFFFSLSLDLPPFFKLSDGIYGELQINKLILWIRVSEYV